MDYGAIQPPAPGTLESKTLAVRFSNFSGLPNAKFALTFYTKGENIICNKGLQLFSQT
jgi:hypothetical protein